MKIDLNKEECKFIKYFFEHALLLAEKSIPVRGLDIFTDMITIHNILEKLEKKLVVEEKIDDKK